MTTKGQLEAEIGTELMRFEKDFSGKGPQEVQVFIVQDMVVVRQRGVLTLAEQQLVDQADGIDLIKQLRGKLIRTGQSSLEAAIKDLTACGVLSLHADIHVERSEKIIVFTLDRNLERELQKQARRIV